MLVFAYIDNNRVARVSVHRDTTENAVLDARGPVPIQILVEDTTVYDSVQNADQDPHIDPPITSVDAASDGPQFDVEDRTIELRVDEAILAQLAQEHYAADDWPDTDQQWRRRWLDTVTAYRPDAAPSAG